MEQHLLRRDPFYRVRRSLKRGFFKMVELNLIGWGALVGTGLALGLVVVLVTTVSPAIAIPVTVLATWFVLLVLDHRRWRSAMTSWGRGGLDRATGEVIVEILRKQGITAEYREDFNEFDGEISVQRSIVCRNGDAKIVNVLLDEYLNQPK